MDEELLDEMILAHGGSYRDQAADRVAHVHVDGRPILALDALELHERDHAVLADGEEHGEYDEQRDQHPLIQVDDDAQRTDHEHRRVHEVVDGERYGLVEHAHVLGEAVHDATERIEVEEAHARTQQAGEHARMQRARGVHARAEEEHVAQAAGEHGQCHQRAVHLVVDGSLGLVHQG